MFKCQICYYDEVLASLTFPSRKDASIYIGFNYRGQVGINIKEVA